MTTTMQRTLSSGLMVLLLAGVAGAGYVDEVTADTPLSYWRLGESGGATAADVMGSQALDYNNLNPADFGKPGAIVGDTDTAVELKDSLNSTLATAGSASGPFGFASGQSFSIEYWINTTDTGNVGVLTKGYDDGSNSKPWYLSRSVNGTIDFFLRDNTGTNGVSSTVLSRNPVNDGQWHHVVGVYDAADAEARLWIDGNLQGRAGGVPAAAYGTNGRPMVVGKHNNHELDGLIDEVAIYGAALDNLDATGGIDAMNRPRAHYLAGADLIGAVPAAAFDVNRDVATGLTPTQVGFAGLEDQEDSVAPHVFSGTGGATLTITNPYDQHRDRGVGGTLAGHPLANMLRDFTFQNADANTAAEMMRFDVTQLEPNTDYRVRVYSYDHGSSNNTRSVWFEGTPASGAFTDSAYRLTHRNITGSPDSGSFDLVMGSDATGALTLHARRWATGNVALFNGMQVEKMPVMADLARFDVDNTAGGGTENATQVGYAAVAPDQEGNGKGVATSNGITVTVDSDRTDNPTRFRTNTTDKLFGDFLFSNAQLTVDIAGLTPGTEYQITIHSQDLDGNGGDASKWSIAGSSDTLRNEHRNYDDINTPVESWSFTTFVTPTSSTLSLVANDVVASDLVFLNGIEIAQAVAPGVAAELKFDMNDTSAPDAVGDTQPGFTAHDLNIDGLLIDDVAVTISAVGGASIQSRDRAAPVDNPPALTQAQIYDDFIFASTNTAGEGMEIEIAGLAPELTYDLTLWSFDALSTAGGARNSDWFDATGPAPVLLASHTFLATALPTADNDYTIVGQVTSDVDGVVRLRGLNSDPLVGVFVNALQLTPVPEPSAFVLFGLALLGLAGRTARRRTVC